MKFKADEGRSWLEANLYWDETADMPIYKISIKEKDSDTVHSFELGDEEAENLGRGLMKGELEDFE